MKARQKKVSIIMGAVWMVFGVVFFLINGTGYFQYRIGWAWSVIQIVTGLMIKTE